MPNHRSARGAQACRNHSMSRKSSKTNPRRLRVCSSASTLGDDCCCPVGVVLRDTRHMKNSMIALFFFAFVANVHAADAPPRAALNVVLVRHGHYVADPAADNKLGPGLSPIGVAQAHLVGARLRFELAPLDALHVSPLQRARDTAAVIGADFPERTFKVIDDLEECTPPTRRAEIMAAGKQESFTACKQQLDRVFATYFRAAEGAERTELFVCHGNVIRYLVTRALGVDSAAWLEMSVGHASITRIRVEADGRLKVIAVGDVGHLPPNMRTGASGDRERSLAIPVLSEAK